VDEPKLVADAGFQHVWHRREGDGVFLTYHSGGPPSPRPGGAKRDWKVLQDIARRSARERGFTFASPREVFEELRVASRGGVADYSGITYEKIDAQKGVFWPCPDSDRDGRPIDHPGTPRVFEPGSWSPVAKGAGPFDFPDGKARFNLAEYEPPTEGVGAEYPVFLTTGRTVNMFLSGNQTRRIGPLVEQYPESLLGLHPVLAKKYGLADGAWVTIESRRGSLTVRCQVVTTIRRDTVFVPYHWAGGAAVGRDRRAARAAGRRSDRAERAGGRTGSRGVRVMNPPDGEQPREYPDKVPLPPSRTGGRTSRPTCRRTTTSRAASSSRSSC
jgi:anaerobic selenocysteine-containing dehydrogenase